MGIHRSGPIFLETSCDGSSASRNETRKTVFPVQVSYAFRLVEHCSVAVIVLVRCQAQLVKHIVRNGLAQIASINLKSEEHDACPETNVPIDLSDNPLFFGRGPLKFRIKDMATLVLSLFVNIPVVLCDFGVGEGVRSKSLFIYEQAFIRRCTTFEEIATVIRLIWLKRNRDRLGRHCKIWFSRTIFK